MENWSDKRVQLLLAFLLSNENLFNIFISKVKPKSLKSYFFPYCALITQAAKIYLEEFGSLPSGPEMMPSYIEEAYDFFPDLRDDEEFKKNVDAWVDEVYSIPTETLEEEAKVGKELLKKFLNRFAVKEELKLLASSDLSLEGVKERLGQIQHQISNVYNEEGPETLQPLLNPEAYVSAIRWTPTNVRVWDELFRGLRHSETYLILGPSGGGKTALATQLGVSVASNGPVLYNTYEQRGWILADPDDPKSPKRSEFSLRAYGSLLNIDRTLIDETVGNDGVATFDDLPEDVKKKMLEVAQSERAKNYIVVDYVVAGLGASSISSLLQDIRRRHEESPLELVIVDPFWPLVMRTCAALDVPSDSSRMRAVAQNMAEQFNEFCKELAVPLVIVHQLGASAAEKTRKKPSLYGSAEIRTLAWRFENVAAITSIRPDGRCGIVRAKARNSGEMNKMVTAVLDGAKNQFIPTSSTFQSPVSSVVDPSGNTSMREAADDIAQLVLEEDDVTFEEGEEQGTT